MDAKQERRWVKSPVQWKQGEREALIAAALARGAVTQVPSVKPETIEKPNSKRLERSGVKHSERVADPSPQSDQ